MKIVPGVSGAPGDVGRHPLGDVLMLQVQGIGGGMGIHRTMAARAGRCGDDMGLGPMRRCGLRLWLGLLVHGLPGEHHRQQRRAVAPAPPELGLDPENALAKGIHLVVHTASG
jgi:hypothetical protein